MDQTSCQGIYPTPHHTSRKLSEVAPLQESILCPIVVKVHISTPVRCTLTEECGTMTEVLNLKMSCPCEGQKDGTEEKDLPYKKSTQDVQPLQDRPLTINCANLAKILTAASELIRNFRHP